jgi:hypothetical protein
MISEIIEEMNFHQIMLDKVRLETTWKAEAGKDRKSRQKMLTEVEGVMRDRYPDGQFALSQCPRTEIN